MHVYILESAADVARKAADMIQHTIHQKTNCILGLATGSTPVATYKELISRYNQNDLDFEKVRTFNLDEYYGLEKSHSQSYYTFMQNNLFQHINIRNENIHVPCGTPENVDEYCREYEQFITNSGGIDLQLLGIGTNGHIGFNEPAEELEASTHLVRLSEQTIKSNSRFFNSINEVPQYAITMGIKTILQAKLIILLAVGKEKSEIIRKRCDTGITTDIPASFLKIHPNVVVIVDKDAGSLISKGVKES